MTLVVVTVTVVLAPEAPAQPAAGVPRIGYLTPFPLTGSVIETFREGLRERGYIDGQNVRIEARSSGQQSERMAALATELVAANVDIIVAQTGGAALAAKRATTRIPIVRAGSADAVAQGLIASLARPGGNVTGFTLFTPEFVPKRIALLREALPRAMRVAALLCTDVMTNRAELSAARSTATRLGIRLEPHEYGPGRSWESLAVIMERAKPDALFMLDCVNFPFDAIAEFSLRNRIPTFSHIAALARSRGMLLSYGPDPLVTTRRAAEYVERILKGERPADLPVEQPSTFELVINLKTARSIGVTIPPTLILRASRIIE